MTGAISSLLIMVLCLISVSGCSDSSSAELFQPPEQFAEANRTWRLSEDVIPEDAPLIEETVKMMPGIAEFDELDGKRVSYTSEDELLRIYWILERPERFTWFYVEYARHKGPVLKAGAGFPFKSEDSL
ncbi:MAG: hypothetical protein KDA65_07525 [Planctomycetaceae bacterium]|nr:hypothetical protein [Planctomycetaceae bacterium]